MNYRIDTMQTDTLRAWFDEILPKTFYSGRPGIDNFETIWPAIEVWPMWVGPSYKDADWLTDTRVIGRRQPFRAKNGEEGLADLLRIRGELEAELEKYRQQMGR